MSKTFKKVISVSTSVTTILWLSGVAALAPMAALAATINEGDTIRVANTFDVYIAKYVGSKNFKRLILSPSVFNSYQHLSWSAVKTVTQAQMDQFTTSTLVRAVGDPKVYSLVPTPNSDSGSKQWVNMTAEAFTAAGYDWDSVYEINTVDRDTYTVAADITGGTSASPSTSAPAVSGAVTVALASDTPAAGVAVEGAARVPFTKVNFTAGASDVTVTALTVQRTGLADDAALTSVALVDIATNLQVGLSQTLNASHQVVFREALTIPANTTKSYYLSANMPATLDAYAGQVAALSLVSVGTTATISGVLPITGNGQTINATLAIGSAAITVGSLDPISASASKEVGTTNFNFAALKVTAGSAEDVTAYSIKWNQSGSAAASDLTNIVVSDGTTSYVATVSSDGKYYTASFGTAGLVIAKGLSKEFTVKGDIANGSARTVGFDIYKDTDIVIKGNTYGYYMTPTFTDNGITHSDAGATAIEAASSPYFAGANVTISSGSLRLDKSSSGAPAANITKGSQGVLLGAFDFVVKGEPVNITSMELAITVSAVAASSSDLTNITLTKADGAILAGPVNAVDTSTSNNDGTATFSGTVTFPVGTTQVLVKGNLNTDPAADATYIVSFTPATKITNITGQTTGNSITATPASQVSANTMTVKAGALTVRVSSTPSAQSVVKGTTGYTFSNFVFDTSASGEDVRVTSMTVRHGAYTASKQSDITALTMYDGSQILNATALTGVEAAATSTETYTFDTALVIPKGGQKVVALKGNISGVATATGHEFGLLNGTTAIAATGVSTGQDIEETVTTGSGQKMTIVDSGQYSVSLDSGSPTKTASKMLVANTTGNIITTLRFRATSEAITINKIGLYLSNASSSAKDIAKVWVYDEGGNLLAWSDSPFNGATAGDDGTTSGFSVSPGLQAGTVALVLQADEEKVVTIKADVAEIKASASTDAVAGHSVAINYYGSTSTTYNYGTGSSGTINNYSAATAANPFYIYRSIPTVVETTPTTSFSAGAGAGSTLDTVAVTADPKGAIDLYKLTFYVSTSSNVALTNIKLYEGSNVLYASSTNWYIDPMGHYIDIVLRQNPGTTATAVPYTIGAGLTKTFVLKGDLSYSGNNTSFTASAYLAGDGAETGKASGTYGLTATNADADTNNDFIWSDWSDVDHSSSATGASTADWYNGYLMNVPSSTY